MQRPILLAVDGIRTSRTAVPAAGELARSLGARVVVLNVREPGAAVTPSLGQAIEEAAFEYLDNLVEELAAAGVEAEPAVRTARRNGPATAILSAAAEYGTQLIVIGSPGPSRVAAVLHGSVAHQVLQGAPCPVLVIPIDVGAVRETSLLSRVVLATDGSAPAARAGTLLRHLLPRGSEVVVVHVHQSPVTMLIASASLGGGGGPDEETELQARQLIEETAARLEAAGIHVRRRLIDGLHPTIADHVVATARESAAGMIALGSRGLSGLGGILLGSVTHSVLRHARRPVLVVR